MQLLQQYNREDIVRVDVHFLDGTIDQMAQRPHDAVTEVLDRVDNMYQSIFEEGLLDCLVAYDVDNNRLAGRTADEYFGDREGF